MLNDTYIEHRFSPLTPAALVPLQDIARENLEWTAALQLPVMSTFDGSDLRNVKDITRELIQLITIKQVHWEKATAEKGTYI